MTLHPFLLPHEWLAKAKDFNDFTQMMQSAKDNVDIWTHITTLAPGLHSPPTDFIPLGLHCDGVPFGSQVFLLRLTGTVLTQLPMFTQWNENSFHICSEDTPGET